MGKILRKLTIGEFIGNKLALLDIARAGMAAADSTEGKEIPLMTVMGRVNSFSTGVTKETTEPWVKLKGNFEATNLLTGELSGEMDVCILPNFIANKIAAAIKAQMDAGDASPAVEFAVTLSIKYKASSAVGYVFEGATPFAPQPSKALEGLKARMAQEGVSLPAPQVKALTAPVADGKKEKAKA